MGAVVGVRTRNTFTGAVVGDGTRNTLMGAVVGDRTRFTLIGPKKLGSGLALLLFYSTV